MKKIFTLLAACTLSIGMATAVSPVKEKRYNFTAEQQAQVSALAKEYMEKDGLGIKEAIMKATEEVGSKIVNLRMGTGDNHLTSMRPDLSTWPTNHAAWLATAPYDGSIQVDRDATIHGYLPSDLVKKVMLKSYSAADEARIQNVRFKGWNGVLNGGDAWMDNNTSLISYGIGNRGLAYFNKGTSDFDLEKGLLLSTADTWGHEGPNECTHSFCPGVGVDGVSSGGIFDIDIYRAVILSNATLGGLLEFDFQPAVGKATFDYIFGSDEYPEYSNTSFNDGFGFFVSGPYETAAEAKTEGTDQTDTVSTPTYLSTSTVTGVNMPKRYHKGKTTYNGQEYNTYSQYNIAQLPNGDPVSVNWTNWGWRNAYNQGFGNSGSPDVALGWQYAIDHNTFPNTMPWDTTGVRGGSTPLVTDPTKNIYTSSPSSNDKCPKAMNPEYHRAVPDSSALMELDGITIKLTAKADSLIPGKWYHLKMVICQKDWAHGDGVFLSNLDLGSANGLIEMNYSGIAQIDSMAMNADRTEFMNLYENCTYPMEIHSDPSAIGSAIALTYIGMPAKALQDADGNQLFKKDTIQLTELKDTLMTYTFKLSPDFEGFQNGQFVGLYVNVIGGGGDTIFYKNLYTDITYNDSITNHEQFLQPTETNNGYLNLGIKGGSPTLSRKIVDGTSNDQGWKLVSAGFTQWELLTIGDSADIILYESKKCCYDTIRIRMFQGPAIIQRYIKIPAVSGVTTAPMAGIHYAAGHQDFTFYAKFNGNPSDVKAIGYYKKDTIPLAGVLQTEGDYAGSYKYVLEQVTQPYDIVFVSKTTAGGVTSNEAVADQMVWTNGNTLYISSENAGTASIYTLAGMLQKQINVNGGTVNVQLPRGFYVVSLNGIQYKIMIK